MRKVWDLRTPGKKLVQPITVNAVGNQLEYMGGLDLNESSAVFASKRWSRTGTQAKPEPGLEGNIHLPLKDETASYVNVVSMRIWGMALTFSYPSHSRFDALLVTYQQLAETSLFTLRLEARCRVMYYLDMATREVRICRNVVPYHFTTHIDDHICREIISWKRNRMSQIRIS